MIGRACALAVIALLTLAVVAPAQSSKRMPSIGYLYPAGGKQGTTFEVLVGGQFLRSCNTAYISGDGVTVKFIKNYRALRNLNGEQRKELRRQLTEHGENQWEQMLASGGVKGDPPWRKGKKRKTTSPVMTTNKKGEKVPVKLPEHPLLEGWDEMNLRQLAHVRHRLTNRSKQQPNAQISEMARLEITIAPDAAPGPREIRLGGKAGLTNPMTIHVGELPEVMEVESNDPLKWDPLPDEKPFMLPVTINGQVLPGDVDRHRFHAKAGQHLVIKADARTLVPFLADAVPGWFQATLAVFDAKGNELAFADDHFFDPDPVLQFTVPKDGVYAVEIRDSIYRGREDFVYRISIGEFPYITSVYPLGGKRGDRAMAQIDGWNLPTRKLTLDTSAVIAPIRQAVLAGHQRQSNYVTYHVDGLPEVRELEPNDPAYPGRPVALPMIVNGVIEKPGDIDGVSFKGNAGDKVVVEVVARRVRSPLDSLVRLVDGEGTVIAWNDDHMDKQGHLHRAMGTLTHHADSYFTATLPSSGTYRVFITDSAGHGGSAYAYRLRISHPQPDFELRVEPSSVNVVTGKSQVMIAHVLRKDGYAGPIELSLVDDAWGFRLDGATIPAGLDKVAFTLTAPTKKIDQPIALAMQGHVHQPGGTITHRAVPCDDVMQAFLWRHLLPAQQTMVKVIGPKRAGQPLRPDQVGPLQLKRGQTVQMKIKTNYLKHAKKIEPSLAHAPEGIAVDNIRFIKHHMVMDVTTDAAKVKPGLQDNLIIELSAELSWKDKKTGKQRTRHRMFGALPAIPFIVVE